MGKTAKRTSESDDKLARQLDRVSGTLQVIRDNVNAGDFDGARSNIEILKRQLADLAATIALQE